MQQSAIVEVAESEASKVSGALVFCGTHVPVAALFEDHSDGAKVAEFLAWFPGVTQLQVEAVLNHSQSLESTE